MTRLIDRDQGTWSSSLTACMPVAGRRVRWGNPDRSVTAQRVCARALTGGGVTAILAKNEELHSVIRNDGAEVWCDLWLSGLPEAASQRAPTHPESSRKAGSSTCRGRARCAMVPSPGQLPT